ncbi:MULTISPECIES: DUF3817 domain-containing protein [unclassified Brachybacterium]|uniref:DUF3817 domain-containing protein n=1 Tax=unclassified Brachybacterium TaxID=2623841 RepID=UPI0036071D32
MTATTSAAPSVLSPSRLFRIVAVAEAVTWALLLAGMFLKYVVRSTELLVSIGGGLHGFVFLAFLLTLVLVAVDQRWRVGQVVLGVVSAIIPFATVPFELWAERRGLLGTTWRLRQEPGRSAPTKLISLALRRPLPAAVIAIAVVAVVFVVLLIVGPPVG